MILALVCKKGEIFMIDSQNFTLLLPKVNNCGVYDRTSFTNLIWDTIETAANKIGVQILGTKWLLVDAVGRHICHSYELCKELVERLDKYATCPDYSRVAEHDGGALIKFHYEQQQAIEFALYAMHRTIL
jgi:hypothetical protein